MIFDLDIKYRQLKVKFNKKYRSGLNFQRRRRRFQAEKAKYFGVFAAEIAGSVLLAFFVVYGFFANVNMAGPSMEPTIKDSTTVFYNRAVSIFGKYKTNSVVVFNPSNKVSGNLSIKRVIGTPGDTVVISSGKVYVNGEVFKESETLYDVDDIEYYGIANDEIVLGKDEYFVLGDNRNNSEDSRYMGVGIVKADEIKGVAWFRFEIGDFGII